jgi:hypothetical protein
MTHTTRAGNTASTGYPAGYGPVGTSQVTGWAGWVAFAGIMLILLGFFQAIEGLVAIFDKGYYPVTPNGLVVNVDYTV